MFPKIHCTVSLIRRRVADAVRRKGRKQTELCVYVLCYVIVYVLSYDEWKALGRWPMG